MGVQQGNSYFDVLDSVKELSLPISYTIRIWYRFDFIWKGGSQGHSQVSWGHQTIRVRSYVNIYLAPLSNILGNSINH